MKGILPIREKWFHVNAFGVKINHLCVGLAFYCSLLHNVDVNPTWHVNKREIMETSGHMILNCYTRRRLIAQ